MFFLTFFTIYFLKFNILYLFLHYLNFEHFARIFPKLGGGGGLLSPLLVRLCTYVKSVLTALEEISNGEQKVLGVRWNFDNDYFAFDLKEIACLARDIEATKRNVVSVAAKFYDPLFLSPAIIEFKIFLQELCMSKVDWDELLEG